MKQAKQFLRPLLMAIVMLVGMLVPKGAWAQDPVTVGDIGFSTIQGAIDHIVWGGGGYDAPLTLHQDLTLEEDYETINISFYNFGEDVNITIDLNGHTITGGCEWDYNTINFTNCGSGLPTVTIANSCQDKKGKLFNCRLWLNPSTKVIVNEGVSIYPNSTLFFSPVVEINFEPSSLVNNGDIYGGVLVNSDCSFINNGRVAYVSGEFENNGSYCAYFNWADDGSSFSVFSIGGIYDYNEEDEYASITSVVTKEPTCTEPGVRTVTGTVFYDGQEYTDTKEVEIPACHDWADEDHTYCNECGHSFIRYTTTGEELDWVCIYDLEENEGLVANVFDSETSSGYLEFDYQLNVISEDAFYNQPLSTVILSWGTNTIDRKAFQDCASLTSITGAWINSIQASAFVGCTSLASVSMPNLSEIKENAFQSCEGLESVDFPSVSTIDDYAFYECTGLSTVSLPKAERIDPSAFHGCTNLTKLSVKCRVNREKGFEDVPEDKIIRLHEGDEITIPEQPATCTEAGHEAYSYCAWCEDLVNPVEIPALGHSFTNKTLTAEPDANGLYAYACDRDCGAHSNDHIIKDFNGEGNHLALAKNGEGYSAVSVEIEDGKAFSTPVEFTTSGVTMARTFTQSVGDAVVPATIMLPFSIEANKLATETADGVTGTKFYGFTSLTQNAQTGKWEANMDRVTGTIQAHTPYMIVLTKDTAIDFGSNEVTFPKTPDSNNDTQQEDWTFVATNEAKVWTDADFANGEVYYGFAAGNETTPEGKFVKVGAGASIDPLRAYIMKTPAGPANAPARAMAADQVPSTITVRLNEESSTGIGTLNTETGQFTFDGWYDLQGRRISEPVKGGISINNNKKIIVR